MPDACEGRFDRTPRLGEPSCRACGAYWYYDTPVQVLMEHASRTHGRRRFVDAMFEREPQPRLDLALKTAASGSRVFPENSRWTDEVPFLLRFHASRHATRDERQIRTWWEKWPFANVGVIPGGRSA